MISGGRKAQAVGKLAEDLVDISLRQYSALGLLAWEPTFPEILITGWTGNLAGVKSRPRNVTITGRAPPDRVVCLGGGRMLWIEVKTWEAKRLHTLSEALHQYETMEHFCGLGALGIYLVMWRWKGNEQWRLHPLPIPAASEVASLRDGLRFPRLFDRSSGIIVPAPDRWPDWLGRLPTPGTDEPGSAAPVD